MNLQKFYMGEAFDAYEYFGAHPEDEGVVFRTYAPNAQRITIIGALITGRNSLWNNFTKVVFG